MLHPPAGARTLRAVGARPGILTATNLPGATARLGRPIRTIADLAELAQRYGHGQVWIHPSAHESLGLPPRLAGAPDPSRRAREGIPHPFTETPSSGWRVTPPGLHSFQTVQPPGSPRSIDVGYLAYDDAAGLAALEPAEAVSALELYASAIGYPYRWSPGHVGAELLKYGRGRWGPSVANPPPPMASAPTETDLAWWRAPTLEELLEGYVHAFDCNGRYLAACASIELGLGMPDELHGRGIRFDRTRPGYWLAELGPHALGPAIPDALPGPAAGPRWYTTPTLELAEQVGALREITHAYVWLESSRALGTWQRRIRDARAKLVGHPEPGPDTIAALGLVKRTYTVTIGSFAGHFREPGHELYRPDWRHHVIALARSNLARRIARAGIRPLAIDVDCIYLHSLEPDPAVAGAGLGLGLGLGDFKHAGTLPANVAARALEEHRPIPALARARRELEGAAA